MRKRKKKKNWHKRIWIVEARFINGTWDVCDFADGYSYIQTNYFKAHVLKDRISNYLIDLTDGHKRGKKHRWRIGDFRVREYKRLKEEKPPHLDPESRFFHKRLIRLEG
jgi:hypothetical protein